MRSPSIPTKRCRNRSTSTASRSCAGSEGGTVRYFTYAKGFRPGGANNPVPAAACGTDFANFGIENSPATFNSDTVDSFEVGAKNNLDNRVKIASSIYYIRWHNIQQVVVPPICQISFIDNLGQAVAKGADIQSEFAVTESFTAELSAGYTEAR